MCCNNNTAFPPLTRLSCNDVISSPISIDCLMTEASSKQHLAIQPKTLQHHIASLSSWPSQGLMCPGRPCAKPGSSSRTRPGSATKPCVAACTCRACRRRGGVPTASAAGRLRSRPCLSLLRPVYLLQLLARAPAGILRYTAVCPLMVATGGQAHGDRCDGAAGSACHAAVRG